MYKEETAKFSWDFYSSFLITIFAMLQILWWPLAPQFIDSYYHLLTSWGFIKAGGYTGWDFWQYAPFGRPHIYPPVFHLLQAFLLKSGVDKIFLLKITETIVPIAALLTFRYFTNKYFGFRFTFFCLIALISSFSFYLSFVNNIPATIALILGFLAFDQLFQRNLVRSTILLSLAFYTHIGLSWFLLLSFIFYGLLDRQYRRIALYSALFAAIVSLPIIWKQVANIGIIHVSNIKSERYFCEFKPFAYILALPGFWIIRQKENRYRLFLAFFLASLIFLAYLYRFFSAQGFIPLIFLSALTLEYWYEKAVASKKINLARGTIAAILLFMCVISPTFALQKELYGPVKTRWRVFDSALTDVLFVGFNKRLPFPSVWFPSIYLPSAELIRDNSREGDIIYSPHYLVGVCLGSLAGRPTANRLLAEVTSEVSFDPFSNSKIIIFLKDEEPRDIKRAVAVYRLIKIGENNAFIFYKNPVSRVKMSVTPAGFPFWSVLATGFLTALLFIVARKID
jgi:hypothetical protein